MMDRRGDIRESSTIDDINNPIGTVELRNTIVTGCSRGSFTSLGHNLDQTDSCQLTGPFDIRGQDPLLGPLQNNGGPTETHTLLLGSPAIDAGDNTACPATDQRGVAQPEGAACDIGAYEFP
jgi:hypothetical protein